MSATPNAGVPIECGTSPARVRAYVGLGTNLGDRLANLASALRALADVSGIVVIDVSPVYETAPLGPGGSVVTTQPAYLNCALLIEAALSAPELHAHTQRIELALGRGEHGQWESRVIDIDLLLFGDERIDTAELTVPHERMHERAFVLRPLVDLDAGLSIPGAGKAADLLRNLEWQGCALFAPADELRISVKREE